MKLNDLSNSLLKYMVKQYSENHKRDFSNIEELARLFPDEDIQFIYDALASLKNDGLIRITYLDNVPSFISLELIAIEQAESDIKLKKAYSFLKEIRDWIK